MSPQHTVQYLMMECKVNCFARGVLAICKHLKLQVWGNKGVTKNGNAELVS